MRWLWIPLVLVTGCVEPVEECADMSQENILSFKGLVLQPNDLGEIPRGALAQADDVVISRDGIIEPRRGQEDVGTKDVSRLTTFKGEIVAHGGTTLSHSADGATWTDYPGTLTPPATPVRSAEAVGNLFVTASDGLKRLDAIDGVPEAAGVPEGLDIQATEGATGTAVPTASQVAYRVLFGKRDAARRLLLGAPSGRAVYTNSSGATKDVSVIFSLPRGLDSSHFFQVYRSKASSGASVEPDDELGLVLEGGVPRERDITQLSRASGVVTATTTEAHGYAAGQIVKVGPGGGESAHAVAIGGSLAVQRTLDGGDTWSGSGISGLPSGTIRAIVAAGSQYVAVGDSVCATSPDGLTWTPQTIPAGDYYAVAWNGSLLVAVGVGKAVTSPDGITWTTRTLPKPALTYRGVAWNGSTWVAVATFYAATSPDGITWTDRSMAVSAQKYGVAWNGTRFVAVGSGSIEASTDGITWTSTGGSLSSGKLWRAAAWSGSEFVAVTSGTGGVAATSPDGITWTARTMPSGDYYAVAWITPRFVAVGASVAAVSEDGVSWTSKVIASGSYQGLAAGGGVGFSSGEKVLTGTPTADSFTYAEAGNDGTLAQAQTATPLTGAATDTVPDGFLGASLYTNANTGEGILAANDQPPAAADIAEFRDALFMLDVTTPAYAEASLLAVSGVNGLQSGDTVTINGLAYTAGASESIADRTFKLETSGSVSQNITRTAASLIRIINRSLASGVTAKDVSDPDGVPGIIGFRATDPVSSLSVTFSRLTAWSPSAGISATPTRTPNGIAWSKPSEPDHVARALTLAPTPVGSKDSAGLRLTPTRDSLLIWKEDGLWRLTGAAGSWSIDPLDPSIRLVAPETAVVLAGSVYALTEQGVVRANEGGVEVVSRDIEPALLPLIAPAMRATTKARAHAVGYESDRKYVLWLPASPGDTKATQAYVLDIFTGAWTRRTDDATDALVNRADDRLYVVNGSTITRERKAFTDADHQDNAGAAITPVVKLSPKFGGNPGALNVFAEVAWIFRKAQFGSASATFSSNTSPSSQSVALSGAWYGADAAPVEQLTVRVPVPQEKARASQLNVGWSQSVTGQPMAIQGVSITFRPCSTRTSR